MDAEKEINFPSYDPISRIFSPEQSSLIQLVRQCGIESAVGCMDWSRGLDVPDDALPWSFKSLKTTDPLQRTWF